MAMSLTLLEYLEWEGVDYELVPHAFVTGSTRTAAIAHVPGDSFAKAVVLKDENGFVIAVVPATHHVDIDDLNYLLDRHLHLGDEQDIQTLFEDCSLGAIPPIGQAYGYSTVVDETLDDCDEVYFEAGDHSELVHVSGHDFQQLTDTAHHSLFSHHN